jgi:hypothetical protein
MNQSNEITQRLSTDAPLNLPIEQASLQNSVVAIGTMPSIVSDRLYQFAAVTAGLFLLATLL